MIHPIATHHPGEIDMSIKTRAAHIARTLGTRSAAGYLRNQGVSLRLALYVLCGQKQVRG
jgi:hypothetical protein